MDEPGRFDQAAATWDLEDRRVVLARGVAEAITACVGLPGFGDVLDFGCGTGLVTLALASRAGTLAGADTSTGMLAELERKAKAEGIPVRVLHLGPDGSGDLGGPYDLIVSSMTLHHVKDVAAVLARLATRLRPGGRMALADLDTEDGTFHDDGADVHHLGFRREDVAAWLEAAGLKDAQVDTAMVTRKGDREYPVFLATALKP